MAGPAGKRRTGAAHGDEFIVDPAMSRQRRTGASGDDAFVVGTAWHRIAALAGRQDGVISRRQLVGLGVRPRTIDEWISQGRLIPVHRGVYAVGHPALSRRGRSVAALLAVGPDAVLSHRWAAAIWGLVEWPAHPHVSVPGRRLRSRRGLSIHFARSYAAADLRCRHGLVITSPLRTLADIGADERAVSEAQVLRRVTRRELESAGGPLARAVEESGAPPTRSELERTMLRIVREAGLPRPLVNHRAGPYVVDFLWPAHGVVVETDGWAAHGHRVAFERDRARDARLQVLGHVVLRFTYRRLRNEPLRVAAQLAQVLAARQATAPG
jgi:very-short-patch-repair endonuclease